VRIGVDRLAALLHDVEELVALKLTGRQLVEDVDSVLAFSQGLRPQARQDAGALQGHESLERRLHALRVAALREQRQLASAVDGLLAGTKSVLLLPVRSLTPYLTAAVRELSRSQHKEIELRLEGDEVEMDRRLLQALREPLVHLLRNAVFHGIEDAAARQAAGKPAQGRLALVIAPRAGGRVVLTVRDDGAGIDTERLAAAARRLQLPLPEDATRENLLQLVFSDGLSTAAGLTQVAGRGVGLAIVRQTVERMAGTVSVHSVPGEGTAFTMTLPLSLATFRAIEVRAGGRSLLVPTAQVERCIRLGAHEQRMLAAQPVLRWGDRDLPLASLAALLELPAAEAAVDRPSCLVLHSAGHAVALAVDEVVGELEVLSKPVDAGLTATPLIAGAAVLGDGRTVVILNGAELVRAALRPGRGGALTLGPAAVPAHARTILLAEDSITSRTLLKNILEVAGYRVEVAADGAQALHKLRAGPFDLVVSDVEMPNLDGIGLTRAIRAEPRFAQLPVVLVTSLASPADRERGAEAGADAYIIKSGFDQADLIQTIAELL
jgi:two-component system chemotaxis sensor kinase CheA